MLDWFKIGSNCNSLSLSLSLYSSLSLSPSLPLSPSPLSLCVWYLKAQEGVVVASNRPPIVDYLQRVDLIQVLLFETSTTRIKATHDGEYLIASGIYPLQVKVYELRELSLKFEWHLLSEIINFEADRYDVRYGGLGLRQLGVASAHCKLDPVVAGIYALMEMGMDALDLPMGMLSDVHLQICEETLVEFVEKIKAMKVEGQKAMAVWSDFSQRWFT